MVKTSDETLMRPDHQVHPWKDNQCPLFFFEASIDLHKAKNMLYAIHSWNNDEKQEADWTCYCIRKQSSHLNEHRIHSLRTNTADLMSSSALGYLYTVGWQQTTYQHRLLPILDPPESSKVGRFSTVKPMIKASVIAVREGYHELSSLLCHLEDNWDTVLLFTTW